jgi:hypothetical protein
MDRIPRGRGKAPLPRFARAEQEKRKTAAAHGGLKKMKRK